MKKPLLFLLLSFCLIGNSQVVPNIDWIRNYSDQNSVANVPSAIDASNNVVVTGFTTFAGTEDFTTVKYNSSGVLQWVVHYNNGFSDRARAIGIDNADNVYVLGQSVGVGTGKDYALVKYNSSGVQQWVVRYNGTGNADDTPLALIIDNTGGGAIYVTGESVGIGSSKDYATLKYNTSGVQQWVHRYNGSGNADDIGVALALGAGNRLFVTGTAVSNTTAADITTIRLNSNTGAMNWVNIKNGTANSTDQSFSLVLDGNDPVVAGKIKNTGTNDDYSVHKINFNTGVTAWSFNYDGFGGNDFASSIAKDFTGNFYLTGIAPTMGGITEYHTIKLNNSGVQQWVNKESTSLTGFTIAPKITVDFLSHMYILGQVKNASGNSDVSIYQVTPTGGNTTWKETHNGSANGLDVGVDFLVNNIGQLYIAALTFNSAGRFDYTTIKISQTPVAFPPDLFGEANDPTMLFYENKGQVLNTNGLPVPAIKYYSQKESPAKYWTDQSLSFVFSQADTILDDDTSHRIDLNFTNSNPFTKIFQFEEGQGYLNYYIGNSGTSLANVKGFQRLMIPNIYPNIDLHYYTNKDGLKYYFVIKPGGDPTLIIEQFTGALSTSITGAGNLDVASILGKITLTKPIAYQVTPSLTLINLGFAPYVGIGTNTYTINTPAYNPLLPLIIFTNEPSGSAASIPLGNICWSTNFGGEMVDFGYAIDVDVNGNQYISGQTGSASFPISPGAIISSNLSNYTYATYSKFNSSHSLVYSTFFGGLITDTGGSAGWDIGVKNSNEVYLVGHTYDSDIPLVPLVGAYFDGTWSGGSGDPDGFIARFDGSGALIWSTYFQSTFSDVVYGVDIDNTGNILITGYGGGPDFPIVTPVGSYVHLPDGSINGFVAKFNSSNALVWSTLYGGALTDKFESINIDNSNNIYVSGYTRSTDFPTFSTGSAYIDNSFNGGNYDATVAKFNSSGVRLWSTFIGGSSDDIFSFNFWSKHALATSNNNMFFIGNTSSTNFPLQPLAGHYFNNAYTGVYDGFIMKFDLTTNALNWSTLLTGPAGRTVISTVATNQNGDCFVGGCTGDATFPIVNYAGNYNQSTMLGSSAVYADDILMYFDPTGQLKWSTFIGGDNLPISKEEIMYDMVFDNSNNLYAVGITPSNETFGAGFPVYDPGGGAYYDDTYNGGFSDFSDLSITKFCLAGLIGINELDNPSILFDIYPNPTNGVLTLETKYFEYGAKIILYDAIGKQCGNDILLSSKMALDVSRLEKGIYFITLIDKNNVLSCQKFIVE